MLSRLAPTADSENSPRRAGGEPTHSACRAGDESAQRRRGVGTESAPRPETALQRLLRFVKSELAAGRPFPSRQGIATHLGWRHPNNVLDALYSLAASGKLRVVGHEGRCRRVVFEVVEAAEATRTQGDT